MSEMYTKIEQDTFNNKHHMSSNSTLYNINGAGVMPMFLKQFLDIPEYVEGEKSVVVRENEIYRLDNISYEYYDTPELLWVIMAVNNITDPLHIEPNTVLRILPKEYIEYNLLRYTTND